MAHELVAQAPLRKKCKRGKVQTNAPQLRPLIFAKRATSPHVTKELSRWRGRMSVGNGEIKVSPESALLLRARLQPARQTHTSFANINGLFR